MYNSFILSNTIIKDFNVRLLYRPVTKITGSNFSQAPTDHKTFCKVLFFITSVKLDVIYIG